MEVTNTMGAATLLGKYLESNAGSDLLAEMVKMAAELLMDGEADVLCNAGYAVPAGQARRADLDARCRPVDRAELDQIGSLEVDPSTDASTAEYITLASIEAELAKRQPRRRGLGIAELCEAADLDDAAVTALLEAGILVRHRSDQLTCASVKAWATGYRPDLLSPPLLGA